MQTTIVTATRVTAMAATEVPVAPTPKPKRPTLGGPRHSSPVLVKPIVLSESEDEQAFENLLRTVIIPLNRPTNLTDASLIPHQLSDTTTLSNQDNGEHDVDDKDGAYAENDYPIAESLVGDIEDVGVAEDESDTPHTESLEVLDEVQISGSLPSVHEELPSEVEEESGDIQGEGLTTIEDQVLDLRVQEPILGEADPEHHQVDLKKRPIETSEQEVGDEEARGDTSSESIVPQDLDQEEAETPEETKDEKEEAEEAEEEMVISPLPVQTLPREPKHKEIVIFGEDLIVEIAAHLWSGSEDEMEPRSPELSATTMVTTAIQLPQSSAVTAATNEPQTQPRSLDTIECISEPAEIMETSVVAPNSANCAVDPKLTGLPQGTLDTVPTMSDLPPLEVGITSLLLLPPLVETDTNVTSLEHQDTSLVPDSPTILATDSQCLVTIQTASPLPSPPSPPPAQPAHARRVTSRRQQRQQYRQEQRQLRAAAAVLRNQRLEARKARVSPWVWKQEGIRHHRLESHQILTKEQVLERFHMELNEDGPNGFFLFKLVRRFQDPAEANSKKTTSTATTAGASSKSSGASGKEASSSKNKGESSVSPSSFAQRLKRQLWLQKSKKEKKSSSNNSGKRNSTASDMGEEDIRSMLMMNNNASMSDLGSSLQEVIDAVDSLKHDSHLWVDEDATVLMEKNGSSEETTPKVVYPQSDDEFAIRDKDHLVEHVLGIERRKGIYSTGRLDGMDLMPKKRFRALQRRSSSKRSSSFISTAASKASSSSSGLETIGDSSTISASATTGSSSLSTSAQPQFKKKAVMQLHIYSRNGLKFKFDVMDNDELHFVEASKKYTFMDPLPAHRQPTLPSTLTRVKEQEQEDETSSSLLSSLAAEHTQNDENSLTRSLNTQRGIHPMYMTNRQLRSSMYVNNHSNASSSTFAPGLGLSNKNKRLSIASTLTSHSTATSSVPSGKRVFVTRLGRHTLLTYHEYKDLAKTPGFLTLGAKLLIQRNISSLKGSSTPSSHPSAAAALSSPPLSASAADDAPLSPLSSSITGSTMTPAAATTVDASIATPLSTSSSASGTTSGEPSDYFAVKKKPIALPGFGKSKSNRSSLTAALNMAASASSGGGSGTPSTPLTPSTPTTAVTGDKPTRAIVTPYNPNDYKTPTPTPASETNSDAQLVGSSNHAKHPVSPTATAFSTAASTVSTTTALSGTPPIQIPSSPPPPPTQPMSPSSPTSPMSPMSSDATIATTVVGAGAVPVNINKKGHQAGLKFHHLFAVVHQRLCKLELEDKTPFMNVGLVQWAPITDPAELRWWRDTVGISMIGWVEGDDPLDESHCGMDVEEDLDDGWEEDSEDEDEDLSESDDDDDDEFFDMQSHFADDDDDKDDDSEKPEGGPLGRPQIAVDEDQRDEDEDIYDRSIGRSPPTSSPIQLRLRPLSTATTATTATFQTACSRLHRVASPTPGSDESMSRGERGGSLRRIRSRSQQQQALPHRRPSVVASSPSSDAAQPPQKRLSKSPRTSTSTTTSHPPRQRPAHIMVERLGYRFVRVSGYTGVLKVTVSEKVEARAVALAIEAQAHVQQWHPSVSDCHQADCELVVLQEKGAEECAKMKRPWEEGAEGIGLEPGEAMIERMSMIVAQARAFKGNYYMKTVKMFNKVRAK
ncbi:hypothetical protein BGZ73_004507 [Actinomortierella ambigua]|nr:hypothetical protein BGZ73_004507 [Actinomortierella ambigua]